MNRSDGMLFRKKERRYVEKKVAPYVVSSDKFPLCFFDDETPAQTEELEQRSRRMAFRSANNRAMLLNERVPRAVLEQLEENNRRLFSFGDIPATKTGPVQTTQIKGSTRSRARRYFNTRRACTKLDNMRDEYRVVVEHTDRANNSSVIFMSWLLHHLLILT